MIYSILNTFKTAFISILLWVRQLFDSVGGGLNFIFAIIFTYSVIRIIIIPFLKGGVGASDPVKRVRRVDRE